MSNRKGFAIVAACAALACTSVLQAGEGLTLARPAYAAAAAPRKPLMGLLDRAGAAGSLDEAGINIGGLVEGSWSYNFDTPDSQINGGRVFDFEDQDLTLNQLQVFAEKTVDVTKGKFDIGGRMEWLWGGDARLIHSNGLFDHYGLADGPDEQFDLTQLYADIAVPVGNGLLVRAGKFTTHMGLETINPTGNPLFSHSYLFGYAIPFTHTGVAAYYNINDKVSVMGGFSRGWEQSLEDNNESVDWLGQVKWVASDQLTVYVNLVTGQEQTDNDSNYRTVIDLIASYAASEQLTLTLNADYGWEADAASDGDDANWYGVAGYATYKLNNMLSLQGRVEYFNDEDGARGLGTSVWEGTFGVNIKPMPDDQYGSGLTIRPEVRYDHADDDIFNDGDDNQFTFGIDAIYAF